MLKYTGRIVSINSLQYTNMDVVVYPKFKYDETTANMELCTDFVQYVRSRYGLVLGNIENTPNRFVAPNWWFNRFACTRSGRPMRLPATYIATEYKDGITDEDYAAKRVLEQLSANPGVADRTHFKLDQGIIFTGFEGGVDPSYMALNPADIDGIRMKYICLDMMPKSLSMAYTSMFRNHKWKAVEDQLEALQKKYPGFTFFKSGMNLVEQALAHFDSAGYYIASVLDLNREAIAGAVNVDRDYKCSFDFRAEIEKQFGKEKVAHYFDDILISRENAKKIKMCYFA